MSRTRNIIDFVKIKLKETAGIDVQEQEIIYASNLIQNQILRETKALEVQIELSLISGTNKYDLAKYITQTEYWEGISYTWENEPIKTYDLGSINIFSIKALIPSWDDSEEIKYIANNKWQKAKQEYTGDYPLVYTQFANYIYLAPIPTTNDTIEIWAYRAAINSEHEQMSNTIEPIIPEQYDMALIYGICTLFDEKYNELYLLHLKSGNTVTHNKQIKDLEIEGNW